MRKLFVTLDAGYAGMVDYQLLEVSDDMSENEIQEEIWQMAIDWASNFGIYLPSEEDDEDDDDFQDGSNIQGFYVEYVPEKHDGYLRF